MERKVSVYPFPFGTRVFMHRNGVIREAEYRGMRIKDTGICGNNVDTEHIFWFGSKLGEEKFKVSMPIYKTVEDAAQETNPVQYEVLNIESFSLKYLPYLVWDGIQFCGWLWDGSRPVKRATYKASEDKLYFKYMLFNLGIVDRWKRESEELIAELEKLCGKKWVNPYTPEKERFTLTLTDEERLLIEERIKAGYYSAENIEKRREETHKAKMLKKRAEICERYDKKIRQAEAEKKIMLCVFDYGVSTDNVIYYPHTNTLSFNWNNYGGKITQEEFDDFVNNVDRSQLPEGIKFELK